MSKCRNPECKNGMTPGIVIKGKGNAKVPILGQEMFWGWVHCLACNPTEAQVKAGAQYRHTQRTPEEIAQRAALADAKAPYKPSDPRLMGVRAKTSVAVVAPTPAADDKVNKLLEQISALTGQVSKLSTQVSELLDENRQLRKQLEKRKSK